MSAGATRSGILPSELITSLRPANGRERQGERPRPTAPRLREAGALATPPAGTGESTLSRIALGTAALAVVDDAFLHPEPGTGAADHLSGGLVPRSSPRS